jgi:hypothetical protein
LQHVKLKTIQNMNLIQKAKLTSYELVVKESKNSPKAMALIPAFAIGIKELESINAQIEEAAIQQIKDIGGVTTNKDTRMDDLNDLLEDVSGAIHEYAIKKKDAALATKVNYNENKISKMSRTDLISASGAVVEEAGKIAPEDLLIQGISTEELKDFEDAYLAYKAVSTDPREAKIEHSGYTKQIANLFVEATNLKKKRLDRLATQFKRKDPDFYQKYQAASIIFYRRSSKKSTDNSAATDTKS